MKADSAAPASSTGTSAGVVACCDRHSDHRAQQHRFAGTTLRIGRQRPIPDAGTRGPIDPTPTLLHRAGGAQRAKRFSQLSGEIRGAYNGS